MSFVALLQLLPQASGCHHVWIRLYHKSTKRSLSLRTQLSKHTSPHFCFSRLSVSSCFLYLSLSTLLFHPLSSISSLNIWSRRVSVSPRSVSVSVTTRVKRDEKTHPCVLPSVFSLLSLSFVISPSFHVLLVNQNTPNTKCILNSLHTRLPTAKYIHTSNSSEHT